LAALSTRREAALREIRVCMDWTARSPASMSALRRALWSCRGHGGVIRAGGPLPRRDADTVKGKQVAVGRLSRSWCAQAVNARHFRRASACRYAALGADAPVLKAFPSVLQRSSSPTAAPASAVRPPALPRPECRATATAGCDDTTRLRTEEYYPLCGQQIVSTGMGAPPGPPPRCTLSDRSRRSKSPLSAPIGNVMPMIPAECALQRAIPETVLH